MNKSESKYFNTAVKMDEALMVLLEKKGFEFITIKELCAEAGVNRSTFYLHYENMTDLLEETLEYLNSKFKSYFETDEKETMTKLVSGDLDDLIFITREHLDPYLGFIKDHKRIFTAAIKNPEAFASDASFKMLSEKLFYPVMRRFNVPEKNQKYMLMFYIKGLVGIITQWIEDDCQDPVEFIAELIVNTIMANLENIEEKGE